LKNTLHILDKTIDESFSQIFIKKYNKYILTIFILSFGTISQSLIPKKQDNYLRSNFLANALYIELTVLMKVYRIDI
jgi:hypothetical protein